MFAAVLLCGGLLAFVMRSLEDLPGRTALENASAAVTSPSASRGPVVIGSPPAAPAPSRAAPSAGVARGTAPSDSTDAAGSGQGEGVRYVEGAGIAAARPTGPLVRAESQAPEPPPAEEPTFATTAEQAGERPNQYKLVIIQSAGEIDVREHMIRLAHIEAPGADEVCTAEAGRQWPCGARARTALRRLVRRRAIDCFEDTENAVPGAPLPADCEVAGINLSEWLVEYGWARPAADAPRKFEQLYNTAQVNKRGLFQPNGR